MRELLPGYRLREGSKRDLPLLTRLMVKTYQEFFGEGDFSHLGNTVTGYFSQDTPLWWVETEAKAANPVACLWFGNAVDQRDGSRYTHIFLLYVKPAYRRQGIGSALMVSVQDWAKRRGDYKIGLQVFCENQPAINLYSRLGFQTKSYLMVKPLAETEENKTK